MGALFADDLSTRREARLRFAPLAAPVEVFASSFHAARFVRLCSLGVVVEGGSPVLGRGTALFPKDDLTGRRSVRALLGDLRAPSEETRDRRLDLAAPVEVLAGSAKTASLIGA